jgi:FAD/FMN-containing dehydrogenase/SAM-dependent methyltransferase
MSTVGLFFSFNGSIKRSTFWFCIAAQWMTFLLLDAALAALSPDSAIILVFPFLWSVFAVATKRYHDLGKSGFRLLLFLIPILGVAWVWFELGFRKGRAAMKAAVRGNTVNDVTQLNPVDVARIVKPASKDDLAALLRETTEPLSIGGGKFSMGGQTSSPGTLHIDMREMKRILHFDPVGKWIRVEAGIRWRDIQAHVDPHDLSVKIMQTYSNFTVGGALSVNAHGRYVGLGPLVMSVRALTLVLADGTVVDASPRENPELFYAAVGAYGAIGIVAEVELDLADNVKVERVSTRLPLLEYKAYFDRDVASNPANVFHNADIYPKHYSRVNAASWKVTTQAVTTATRLIPEGKTYLDWRYFMWAITETPFGHWRREHIVDPLLFGARKVHYRNYEASYDVAELEPSSRAQTTYVLQEYFVPVGAIVPFVERIAEILLRHRVNVVNISIRHAMADPGTLLAWAREEVFAYVLYYKQGTDVVACNHVAVWTRELIDAALEFNGTYYLPYQPHARPEQFHRAYPQAETLFALKKRLDPAFRFHNSLWDKYYTRWLNPPAPRAYHPSEFIRVFSDARWRDDFFRFLQVVYTLYPEDRFHHLIVETCREYADDKEIYLQLQQRLPAISPPLSMFRYALPALFVQKKEMTRQTLQLLGGRTTLNGVLEIGSTGRYVSDLGKHVTISGPVVLMNDLAPTMSPVDIMERAQLKPLGSFVALNDYRPDASALPEAAFDMVSCFIGLHHCPVEILPDFIGMIRRSLRPGGVFILRDHAVNDEEMRTFVSLVHTVFNAGIDVKWEQNQAEYRNFQALDYWVQGLEAQGLRDSGKRLLQANDPSLNTLMVFTRE